MIMARGELRIQFGRFDVFRIDVLSHRNLGRGGMPRGRVPEQLKTEGLTGIVFEPLHGLAAHVGGIDPMLASDLRVDLGEGGV